MTTKPPDAFSRRAALQGLGLGLVAAGCGVAGDDESGSSEEQIGANAALSPSELLAGVEHLVVLMMENRSFDHYLGALATDAAYPFASRSVVEGLRGNESNPDPTGASVPVFKLKDFTPEDLPHSWDASRVQWNAGQNDGFVKAHAGGSEKEAMGFHDRTQIPFYYWLADNFTVCDHWFSSVLGPTWPNRFFLHAATSNGFKDNRPIWDSVDTIWDALRDKQLDAKNYAAGFITWFAGGFPSKVVAHQNPSARIRDFFAAAQNGTLPPFSLIDPDFLASDDHPSHNILRGQAFVASVYKALAESPLWPKTLLVITYDENGGFFDHVSPPKTVDERPDFEQLGFRVPAFVVGPMVKNGYVSKVQLEHSSVAATLKTRFGIRSLNARVDATNDLSDCIDPAKVKAGTVSAPPPGMPTVVMSVADALHDGVGENSQPYLDVMVARGEATPIDTRDHATRIGEWLEDATRLGAVRLIR